MMVLVLKMVSYLNILLHYKVLFVPRINKESNLPQTNKKTRKECLPNLMMKDTYLKDTLPLSIFFMLIL